MLYRDYLKNKYQNTAVKLANAEGVPCVLEYSKGKNMRNYEVYGNSVQDGTPSPESPVEIQSVGDLVTDTKSEYYGKYDIPITVTGKNLFDIDKFLSLNGNSTYYSKNTNGELVQIKVDYRNASSIPVLVTLPIGIYNLSISNTGVSSFYIVINGKSNGVGRTSFTLTKSSDIGLKFYESTDTVLGNIQIELGSSATEYEPYKGSITEHIYLDEPLRKVGDYSDYIDFKNQKVVRKIEVLDDTGTKTISESFGTLATPTEENISLPALKTFKGTSIMSVDTAVLPSNIKAKYIRT